MSAKDVANAFVQHFYNTFDNNPSQLAGLFNQTSMMTFEGVELQGPEAIVGKLTSVGKVNHNVKSTDVQPSSSANAIVIFVTGTLQIDGGNPLHFAEIFQLVSTAPQQYYVHNNVFRLLYGL